MYNMARHILLNQHSRIALLTPMRRPMLRSNVKYKYTSVSTTDRLPLLLVELLRLCERVRFGVLALLEGQYAPAAVFFFFGAPLPRLFAL